MNIIKVENVKIVTETTHSLEIKTNNSYSDKTTAIVVLSDEDMNNKNCTRKLCSYTVSVLIIPKKYKFTFKETPIYSNIGIYLIPNFIMSYY
jgi:hypothetical protein